jgi:hypothetical protein
LPEQQKPAEACLRRIKIRLLPPPPFDKEYFAVLNGWSLTGENRKKAFLNLDF